MGEYAWGVAELYDQGAGWGAENAENVIAEFRATSNIRVISGFEELAYYLFPTSSPLQHTNTNHVFLFVIYSCVINIKQVHGFLSAHFNYWQDLYWHCAHDFAK
jgi:hypothetical protein